MTTFSWLHLTDLHLGMAEHPSLLPAMKDKFFEDLKPLHDKSGPWDLVVFTGDLTQRGAEFEQIDKFLVELWDRLKALGSVPPLVAIPGNHDLVRPNPDDPSVLLLNDWIGKPKVRDQFWNNPASPYRKVISEAFNNYITWWDNTPIKKLSVEKGMLPGDFSCSLQKEGASLGIVGFNSTFLQLGAGDYAGKLALSPLQFQKVCKGDGPAWVKAHNASILLTHQPPDWLTPDSKDQLRSEIAAFFDVHLFGHMHEGRYQSLAEGGQPAQRAYQGMSVFGLEYFGDDQKKVRLHGYAVGRIELENQQGSFLFWPRRADRPGGGQWHFAPASQDFVLLDEHVSAEPFLLRKPLAPAPAVAGADRSKTIGKRWAILVGVNNYEYFPKLNFCRNDIDELAESLRDPLKFDHVFQFPEPQRHLIFNQLAELQSQIKPDDLLLFYFSGHGLNIGGQDYLLPIEASPKTAKNLGIKVDDLVEALTETGCRNISMFIDACREILTGARGTTSIGDESRAALSKAGIVTFFSCNPQDRSYEIDVLQHGSFTYCILEAIRWGKATTALELDTYLKENVPRINKEHEKPAQQPYSVIEPQDRGELEILFNPKLQQEMLALIDNYSARLFQLYEEQEIEEAVFWSAGQFLRRIKDKKQRDVTEKTKVGMIQALCDGSRSPEEFCWAWKASLSRSQITTQIKKLNPLV